MNKKILVTGAFFGVLGIILGAFASHGLKELITKEAQQSFETGVRYQMYHALLLLFAGNSSNIRVNIKKLMLLLVIIGVLLFSGSIYGLATNDLTGFNFKNIAFITPIGGFLLMLSWLIMLLDFLKLKDE